MLGVGVGDGSLTLDLAGLFVEFGSQVIDASATGIVALEGVTVGQARELHNAHPAAAFSGQPIFLVFDCHHFVAEGALEEIEVQAIHRQQFGQKHCLQLGLALEIVAKHEAPLFASVRMQVDIDLNFAGVDLLLDSFLHGPDRWLVDWARVDVVAIQVLRHCIESIVATIDTIWVEHGHHFEDEAVPQDLGLCALLVCQEFPYASQYKRGRSLTRVHSRRYEYRWFVKLEWSSLRITISLREEAIHKFFTFICNLFTT